ncbi:hypothetical protein BASA81_008510 [Batrachochytrium salamandrivorans]|nr:hypothetical protein BASA81_008510 [Batrachochytrium salamandrivorans]
MLIPVALVASSASNGTTHGFVSKGSSAPTIGLSGQLPVSPLWQVWKRDQVWIQHLVHVIPPRLLDLGQYRPLVSVAEELNSHVSMEDVARNMASVELRQSTVVLIVSQSLAHVIPIRLLDLCQCQRVAGVEGGLSLDVGQTNVAHQLASVELRKSIVALDVSRHLLYRNRYWLTPQTRPKTVKQRHSFALMETLRTSGDSASLQKYVTRQLLDTSGFFKDPSFDQSRAHGTRYLMLARMDALWTARKAIQIGILVDTHPFSVDHCILCDQQLLSTSIAHLVVECEQVTDHRIQPGLVPAIQKSRLRLLGRSTRSGCGECIYLAPRWSLKWRSRSGPGVGWTGL